MIPFVLVVEAQNLGGITTASGDHTMIFLRLILVILTAVYYANKKETYDNLNSQEDCIFSLQNREVLSDPQIYLVYILNFVAIFVF